MPKIGDFHLSFGAYHNIARFDIAVNHALGIKGVHQTIGNLLKNQHREGGVYGTTRVVSFGQDCFPVFDPCKYSITM